jgi:hypothetical protein
MVPEAYPDGVQLDPEKMFVATLASAHVLSWLHLAFAMGAEDGELSGRSGGRPERAGFQSALGERGHNGPRLALSDNMIDSS